MRHEARREAGIKDLFATVGKGQPWKELQGWPKLFLPHAVDKVFAAVIVVVMVAIVALIATGATRYSRHLFRAARVSRAVRVPLFLLATCKTE